MGWLWKRRDGHCVRVDIPRDIWIKLDGAFDMRARPEKIVRTVIENRARLAAENSELRRSLGASASEVASMKDELALYRRENYALKNANAALSGRVERAKRKQSFLEARVGELEAQLKSGRAADEKVVYREDTETLQALRKKRDVLEGSLWAKEETIQKMQRENDRLKESLTELRRQMESWSRKHFAVVVSSNGWGGALLDDGIGARVIDSSEYYLWKADSEAFRNRKGIRGRFLVVPMDDAGVPLTDGAGGGSG